MLRSNSPEAHSQIAAPADWLLD